jgi:hypothetical protein
LEAFVFVLRRSGLSEDDDNDDGSDGGRGGRLFRITSDEGGSGCVCGSGLVAFEETRTVVGLATFEELGVAVVTTVLLFERVAVVVVVRVLLVRAVGATMGDSVVRILFFVQ